MSTYFTTRLLDAEVTFAKFGTANPFESFTEYAVRELTPFITGSEIPVMHCLISGFPTGILNRDEIAAMIASAVSALDLATMGGGLEAPSDSAVGAAFELIVDHVAMRVIETSRPAPSLTFSKGRLAIVGAHWTRQLAVLVSTLLYDAGQLREKEMRYTDKVLRIQSTIEMAEYIASLESNEQTDELFSALIELDAKFSIKNLNFTRKEAERLVLLRQIGVPTLESIHEFALQLLARRDSGETEVVDGVLWTKDVYQQRTFAAVDREKHSNLFKPDNSNPKRYTEAARKKRGRPVDPTVQARKAEKAATRAKVNMVDAFDAAWADAFKKSE